MNRLVALHGVPHYHGVVIGSRHQAFTVLVFHLVVSFQSVRFHFSWITFELEMLSSMVVAASLEHVVGTQCQSVDPMAMAFQFRQLSTFLSIPNLDHSVLTCRVDKTFSTPKNLRD